MARLPAAGLRCGGKRFGAGRRVDPGLRLFELGCAVGLQGVRVAFAGDQLGVFQRLQCRVDGHVRSVQALFDGCDFDGVGAEAGGGGTGLHKPGEEQEELGGGVREIFEDAGVQDGVGQVEDVFSVSGRGPNVVDSGAVLFGDFAKVDKLGELRGAGFAPGCGVAPDGAEGLQVILGAIDFLARAPDHCGDAAVAVPVYPIVGLFSVRSADEGVGDKDEAGGGVGDGCEDAAGEQVAQAVDAVGSLDDGAGVWARAPICGFGVLRATRGACMMHHVVSFLRVNTEIGRLSLNAESTLSLWQSYSTKGWVVLGRPWGAPFPFAFVFLLAALYLDTNPM